MRARDREPCGHSTRCRAAESLRRARPSAKSIRRYKRPAARTEAHRIRLRPDPDSDWSHPGSPADWSLARTGLILTWTLGHCLILTRTGLILTRTGAMRPSRSFKDPPLRDRSLKEPTGRRRRRLLLRRSASLACGALAIQTDCPGPVSERPAGPWLAVDLRAPHPVPPGPRIPRPGRPGWPGSCPVQWAA